MAMTEAPAERNVHIEQEEEKGLCKFSTQLKGFIDIGSA